MKSFKITQSITDRKDASLGIYFKDVSKLSMITSEKEVELTKRIKLGDKAAANELVTANLRFVISVAKQYQNKGLDLVDLIQEGNIGMLEAAYKFDETRGYRFISYAVWWIRQSIQQAIVLKARAESELKELSERELDIIRMYFGFGREKASIEEIQTKYDLTPQRAMAIKEKALRKLFKSKEKLSIVRKVLLGDAENEGNKD